MKKFGEFIRNVRLSHDESLRSFCQRTGVDPTMWSKLEQGKVYSKSITIENLAEICFLIDVPKDDVSKMMHFLMRAEDPKMPTEQDVVRALPVFLYSDDIDKTVG